MEKCIYDQLAKMGPRNWVVYAKSSFIMPYMGTQGGKEILDAGCGSGAMLGFLGRWGRVTGMDFSSYALTLAGKNRSNEGSLLVCGDVTMIPLPDSYFDTVTLLDVLYHRSVEDEDRAIGECRRVLKDGGSLIVIDSAFNFLRTSYDDEVHVARRYTIGEMRDKLVKCGFRIKKASYLFFFIFPIVFAIRYFRKFRPLRVQETDHIFSMNPVVNTIMRVVICIEALLSRIVNFPFGVSVLCVGIKE